MKKMLGWVALIALFMGTTVQASAQKPEDMVREAAQKVMTALRKDKAALESDPDKLYALVNEAILPIIDFDAMAKLTLGKNWRQATPEQREQFVGAYRSMLIRTYTKSLLEYADSEITFLPPRGVPDDKYVTVYTELDRGQGRTHVPVNYSLRRVGDEWRVYDVVIDGLSMVKNYRTSFTDEINQTSLDALIARLSKNTTVQALKRKDGDK